MNSFIFLGPQSFLEFFKKLLETSISLALNEFVVLLFSQLVANTG
jgi:hypothetical protein